MQGTSIYKCFIRPNLDYDGDFIYDQPMIHFAVRQKALNIMQLLVLYIRGTSQTKLYREPGLTAVQIIRIWKWKQNV